MGGGEMEAIALTQNLARRAYYLRDIGGFCRSEVSGFAF